MIKYLIEKGADINVTGERRGDIYISPSNVKYCEVAKVQTEFALKIARNLILRRNFRQKKNIEPKKYFIIPWLVNYILSEPSDRKDNKLRQNKALVSTRK